MSVSLPGAPPRVLPRLIDHTPWHVHILKPGTVIGETVCGILASGHDLSARHSLLPDLIHDLNCGLVRPRYAACPDCLTAQEKSRCQGPG